MKITGKRFLFLSLLVFMLFISLPVWSAPKKLSVAILGFEADSQESAENIRILLENELTTREGIKLVSRDRLNEVMEEQSIGSSGRVSSETANKVGEIVGAHVLITGRTFTMDHRLHLSARLIGTETSRLFTEMQTTHVNKIREGVRGLASKIARRLENHYIQFLAIPEFSLDIGEILKHNLSGKKLPSVSVNAHNTGSSRELDDPVLENVLVELLTSSGIPVRSPLRDSKKNDSDVDVVIDATARTDYLGQDNELHAVKAFVELKALSVNSNQVIATTMESSDSVDASQMSASREAIKQATLKSASSFIMKMVNGGE